MKKYKLAILGAALAVASMGVSQASIILSGTATLTSAPDSGATMTVQYSVDEISAGDYTYTYILATTPTEPISAFNIAIPDSTAYASINLSSLASSVGLVTAYGDGTSLHWAFSAPLSSGLTVSYSSTLAPGFGNAGATDSGTVSWNSPGTVPIPISASVPEPSTVVAGALLLLPFGVSTLRILRKKQIS